MIKKIYKIGIIILLLMFFILPEKSEASSSYLFLNLLRFEAQIQYDGSMEVTEYWDIDIEETNTLYKTFELDKTKYSNITNVKVTDITDGKNKEFTQIYQEMYHVTKDCYYGLINKNGLFEIAWGVGLDNNSDTRKYKIQYTVEDAICKYNDKAQLYWQFVGKDFEVTAKKVEGIIKLPESAEIKDDIKVWGHTEDLNGEIYVTDNQTIEFDVYGRNAGKFIEIRTLFPTEMIIRAEREENKNILQQVIAEETIWAEEANERRARKQMIKNVIAILESIIAIVLSIVLIRAIIKKSKETKKLNKIKPTQKVIYYREMPREDATPAEALYLYKKQKSQFMSDEIGKIFSASLLDLSLKKCISFEVTKDEKGKEIIYIQLQKDTVVELTKDEIAVLEFIIQACEGNSKITVKELKKYIEKKPTKVIKLKENIDQWVPKRLQEKKLEDNVEKEKYNKSISIMTLIIVGLVFSLVIGMITIIELAKWLWIAIVPLVILEITYLIVLSNFQSKINVFTQSGIDEIEKWKGLKKYMENFSMMDKKEIPEIVLWEKFLVYATVFGIAQKVLKQLKIVYPNIEEAINTNNYTYMYFMINSNFASSFSNAVSTAMTSSYSSATGGGGGFSGGGGGGRRPAAGGGGR